MSGLDSSHLTLTDHGLTSAAQSVVSRAANLPAGDQIVFGTLAQTAGDDGVDAGRRTADGGGTVESFMEAPWSKSKMARVHALRQVPTVRRSKPC